MRVVIKKWGNSTAVRLPASVMEAASLSLDESVEMRHEGGCIVIVPIRPQRYDLADPLSKITPANVHEEVSFPARE